MAPFEVDARSSPLSPFSLPSLDRVTNPSNGARIRIVVAHSFNSHAGDRRPTMVHPASPLLFLSLRVIG